MGISEAQYDETSALTIDWDLELAEVEARAQKNIEKRTRS